MFKLFFSALCCFALASCSSSSSTSDNAVDTVLMGVFLDSAVQGLSYETETLSGMTDAEGQFQYVAGETVTFSIGALILPTVSAESVVTPLEVFSTSDTSDVRVMNLARQLQSIDEDGDTDNGILISSAAIQSAPAELGFAQSSEEFENDTVVINFVANSGSVNSVLIPSKDAALHLRQSLVESGAIESLSRREYTELAIGNTLTFRAGLRIYYGPEGEKIVERGDNPIMSTTWRLDENNLLCELINDGSEFCIADAEDYLMTKHPESDLYQYSDSEFVSSISVSEGNTIGATVTTEAACAADPATVNTVPGVFRYEDIAGKNFIWVGDDDNTGTYPINLKMGEDCVLRAKPGYENFGDAPTIVAEWQYTIDGAIRIIDWSDQFSLVRTTEVAHEICWATFSSCNGEGRFRSEGGVRRLFFNEADARAYFDSL